MSPDLIPLATMLTSTLLLALLLTSVHLVKRAVRR